MSGRATRSRAERQRGSALGILCVALAPAVLFLAVNTMTGGGQAALTRELQPTLLPLTAPDLDTAAETTRSGSPNAASQHAQTAAAEQGPELQDTRPRNSEIPEVDSAIETAETGSDARTVDPSADAAALARLDTGEDALRRWAAEFEALHLDASALVDAAGNTEAPGPLIAPWRPIYSLTELVEREEALGLPARAIRGVQAALAAAGHYDGRADGALGPQSRKAILAFQHAQNLAPTAHLDTMTLAALELAFTPPAISGDTGRRRAASLRANAVIEAPVPPQRVTVSAPVDGCQRSDDGRILPGQGLSCDLKGFRDALLSGEAAPADEIAAAAARSDR